DRLLATRPADAVEYVPTAFRVEARDLGPLSEQPEPNQFVPWPFETIDLAQVASAPIRLEGEEGMQVAQFVVEQGIAVSQGDRAYLLGVFADPPRPTTS
ncbi:MAG: hypothetical protein ACRDIB_20100, partial [Ardenticatenaceae bacterium]